MITHPSNGFRSPKVAADETLNSKQRVRRRRWWARAWPPRRLGGVRLRLDHAPVLRRRRRPPGSCSASAPRLAACPRLVHVGHSGAVGAGRADRLARRRRVPRERDHLRGHVTANSVNGGFNAHATLDGLQENTAYSYRVGTEGAWSATYAFKTQTFSDGNFDFLFFGDPQIGSSGDEAKDGAGWSDTLNVALAANPNTELLVSGGDQVETANTESQWNAFLLSDKLRSYPWAATIGNHDVGGKAYEQHFWTPNTDRSAAFYAGSATTTSGGDYWYMYKGVLFIHLNSNAYANGSDAAHIGYVTSVVQAHPEAKYKVLVYHHSIYSPADHANDSDNQQRRRDFPTAFSNLGIDLVLQGHDHSYSRPTRSRTARRPTRRAARCRGRLRGSRRRDLRHRQLGLGLEVLRPSAPRAGSDFGPDPLDPTGNRHWANSVENQEHVRTYVRVQVGDGRLTVEDLRSGTCAAPNAAVERGNVSWCGPNKGASPALAVGTPVDKVVIRRMATQTGGGVGGNVPATLALTLGTPGRVRRRSRRASTRTTRLDDGDRDLDGR